MASRVKARNFLSLHRGEQQAPLLTSESDWLVIAAIVTYIVTLEKKGLAHFWTMQSMVKIMAELV